MWLLDVGFRYYLFVGATMTPTIEEVAGWLKEAADNIQTYAAIHHFDFNGNRENLLGVIKQARSRAAPPRSRPWGGGRLRKHRKTARILICGIAAQISV